MKRLFCISILSFLIVATAFGQLKSHNLNMNIFNETPILFNPTDYPDGVTEKDGFLYWGNGRIALKKIHVPPFKRNTKVEIQVTLISNGDPWDK